MKKAPAFQRRFINKKPPCGAVAVGVGGLFY